LAIKEIYPKTDSNVRLKQHSLQPEYAEKAMKIVINVIPEAFIGNPVSLKGAGNHLDSCLKHAGTSFAGMTDST